MCTTLNPPKLQEDETLYSYIARCQWLWGQTNHINISNDWFGKGGVCLNQCLPCHLSHFPERTGNSIEELLAHHTALPLHVSFNHRYKSLRDSMLSDNNKIIANLACAPQLSAGLQSDCFYCPECAHEDREKVGVAYWHLSHQFWGITACWKHGCELVALPFNSRKYRLPHVYTEERKIKTKLADNIKVEFANRLLEAWKAPIPLLTQQHETSNLVRSKGLLTEANHLKSEFITAQCKAMSVRLSLSASLNPRMIRRITFDRNLSIHPLRGFLLLFTLEQLPDVNAAPLVVRPKLKKSKRIEQQTKALLESYKFNIAEISRRVKVSHGYVRNLAKRLGIYITERKQKVTADIERQAIDLAIENMACKDIANKLGISEPSVCNIVQSVSGLSLWRQYLKLHQKRKHIRELLESDLRENPEISNKEIRERHPNEISWVYKYDSEWFGSHFPHKVKRINHSRVIWKKRDKELLPKFKSYLRQYCIAHNDLPTKYALDKKFDDHRWFTSHFEKLPRCKRLYEWVAKKLNLQSVGAE